MLTFGMTKMDMHRFSRSKYTDNASNFTSMNIKGEDIHVIVDLDIKDLLKGNTVTVKYDCRLVWFEWKGTKASNLEDYIKWSNWKAAGYDEKGIWHKCNGTGGFSRSKCKACTVIKLEKVTKQIVIPPATLKYHVIPGLGHWSKAIQGLAGDLIVKINLIESDDLKLSNYDVVTNKTVTFSQSGLGQKVTVQTLLGPKTIKLNKWVQSNDELHVEKMGVPHDNGFGKLIIKFKVLKPQFETNELVTALQNLSKLENIPEEISHSDEINGSFVSSNNESKNEKPEKEGNSRWTIF